jgi:predicted metal-binding membrane protein
MDSLENALRQDRLIVLAALTGLAFLGWLYLWHDARSMHCLMMGMKLATPQGPSWGGSDLAVLFLMWAIMMVAMMVPSVAPMVLTFAAVNRKRREQERPFVPTSVFLLGYLAVWTAFSALATGAQWVLHSTTLLSASMVLTSPLAGSLCLAAAGLFQLTSLKRACLVHCRNPLAFLMTEWREGVEGAWLMGLRHGAYCLGCCWLLMALLFVAGVMNLAWVAVLSAFVLLEKILPERYRVSRISGWLLMGWGAWLLAMGSGILNEGARHLLR